ncbi:MAG: protein kinase, partial [Thermoanaerobaculia bacterium]|nr:protein kinase [Thermoanaerobaculia bacterium]
ILDFGLAKLAGATHITQSKTTLGTLAYMAPEQLKGETVGPAADLWSLGLVLFELLTGQRPFRGDYEQAMAYSILNEQPLSLLALRPEASAELDRLVKKLLRKDPLQRYQTAEEVIAELEALERPGSGSGSGKGGSRATRSREALRSGARLGPYEIAEPLGSGGMGDVYRARDTRLDRQVAIKVLAPEFGEDAERKQRFQREAKTISSLSHPNICTLFDVGEQEGTDYLVMEYLEGETLADRLTKGALALSDVLKIGVQIGEALGKAHQQGIVHRDLKPGNVMLTKSGAVKLVDFGLAKDIGAVTSTPRRAQTPDKPLTAEGAIVGTLAYMAPEQVEGREADARSDIFAFGAILYEMATGRRAFEGATKASLIAAILDREPPSLADVRGDDASSSRLGRSLPAIAHLVHRCLEKDAEHRWQSVMDVASELRWISENAGRQNDAAETAAGRAGPGARAWAAAALIAVLAVIAGYWFGRRAPAAGTSPAARATPSSQKLVGLTREAGIEESPCISPDGSSFAYVKQISGNADIFFRRVGGETSINLTKSCDKSDTSPVFSPDGQTIAFRSERDGGGIYLMGSTGESVRRLTDFGHDPAWSPDGKSLAVGAEAAGASGVTGTGGLWLVDVATGAMTKLWEGSAQHPSWSPSGKRIVFAGFRVGGGRYLFSIAASGGEVNEVFQLSSIGAAMPEWTRDGVVFGNITGEHLSLWRVRIDETTGILSSGPEQVFEAPAAVYGSSTSADGRRMVFQSVSGIARVTRRAFDPLRVEPSREIEEIFGGRLTTNWTSVPSPDGTWLANWEAFRGQMDIFLVNTSTRETRRLTRDANREEDFAWAPDGSKLYYSVGPPSGKYEVWSIRPDGSSREREVAIAGEDVFAARPSSDGRFLYLLVSWSYLPHVVDLTLPPGRRKPMPLPPIDGDRHLGEFTLSPDGKWLVGHPFSKSSKLMGVPFILFDVERQSYRELATPEGSWSDWLYWWLPDSRRVLLWRRGNDRLRVLDRVSGAISPAGSIGEGVGALSLSGDGRTLFEARWSWEGDIWMLEHGEEK